MPENANAASIFVDWHVGSAVESKPAFIEASGKNRQITYGELAEESGRMAALYEKHGIKSRGPSRHACP